MDPATSGASVASGLTIGLSIRPELLREAGAELKLWQDRLEADGLDVGTAALVRSAVDGAVLADVLEAASGVDPAVTQRRTALRQRLHEAIDQALEQQARP